MKSYKIQQLRGLAIISYICVDIGKRILGKNAKYLAL